MNTSRKLASQAKPRQGLGLAAPTLSTRPGTGPAGPLAMPAAVARTGDAGPALL